jgi:hypothetical protein
MYATTAATVAMIDTTNIPAMRRSCWRSLAGSRSVTRAR